MQEQLNKLLDNYLTDSITVPELKLLNDLIADENNKQDLAAYIDAYLQLPVAALSVDPAKKLSSASQLLASIKQTNQPAIVHRVHFLRTAWFRYAAAVILLLGIGGYILWKESGKIPAQSRNDKASVVRMQPSNNHKAILTLADGSQITLDDKASGNIAQQGNTRIIKLDANQLTYNSNIKTSPPAMEGTIFDPREAGQKSGVGTRYNTITTPKGSQYQVTLPDGTKTWLNAESSIKFPTAFEGNTRNVEITGEIYFEVAVNKMHPFFVRSKGTEVQVLGTSFNINAYGEGMPYKTSLLEGAVKVNGYVLSPGQAYINGKVTNTDIEQDIAWKNGLFNFTHLTLQEAMSQLSHWYDVEIVYEGQLPQFDFYGKIERSLSLRQVLNILSGLRGVNFRLEGRRVIVSQ